MFDCIEAWRQHNERRALTVGKSVVAMALIAGCSWVPDAVNPIEWYKGVSNAISSDEHPDIAAPRRPDGSYPNVTQTPSTDRKQPSKGLAGDRENSKYAESAKREPNPTTQLAKKTPPAGQPRTEVAQAPAAPQDGKGTYQPSLDRRMQTARDDGPSAPPRVAPGGPPARADVPDSIPTRRTVLGDHYQRRLAESAAATNKSGAFDNMPPARTEASYNQPAHTYAVPANAPVGYARATYAADYGNGAPELTPPRGVKGTRGAKGAVIPSGPAASFEVASMQFGGNGGLTATDRAALKEVAALQRQTGGTIRIVGLAPSGPISFIGGDESDIAIRRANAVAKTLTGMGVPARKVLVAADPSGGVAFDDSGAKVSIEY
jgi:outer membrane protein OmpA-like peptidoglycan-associated protein